MIFFTLFLISSFIFSAEHCHKIHPSTDHRTSTIRWISQNDDNDSDEEKDDEDDILYIPQPLQPKSNHIRHNRQHSVTVNTSHLNQTFREKLDDIEEDPDESNTDAPTFAHWATLVTPESKTQRSSESSTETLCDPEESPDSSPIIIAPAIQITTQTIATSTIPLTTSSSGPASTTQDHLAFSASCCGCCGFLRSIFK